MVEQRSPKPSIWVRILVLLPENLKGVVARVKTTHVQQPLRHTSYAFGNQFFQIDFEILKPAITFN